MTNKHWWEATSWREQQEIIATLIEKNKDKLVPTETDALLRHFNPSCAGKHDRTSYDIMQCDECAAYTKTQEEERKVALAPPTHEVYLLETEEPMTPDRFQSKEDGPWHTWQNGPIDTNILRLKVAPDNKQVYINGCLVVALAFPHADETKKQIWHCAQGWKKPGML